MGTRSRLNFQDHCHTDIINIFITQYITKNIKIERKCVGVFRFILNLHKLFCCDIPDIWASKNASVAKRKSVHQQRANYYIKGAAFHACTVNLIIE